MGLSLSLTGSGGTPMLPSGSEDEVKPLITPQRSNSEERVIYRRPALATRSISDEPRGEVNEFVGIELK